MSINQTEDQKATPSSLQPEDLEGRGGFLPSIFAAVALGLLLGLLVYRRRPSSAATMGQTMAGLLRPGAWHRRGIAGMNPWTAGWERIQRAQTGPARAWWRRARH